MCNMLAGACYSNVVFGIDCTHEQEFLLFDTSGSYRENQVLPCNKLT